MESDLSPIQALLQEVGRPAGPSDFEPSGAGVPAEMGERTKLGLGILGVALTAGALGDALLQGVPWVAGPGWGINLPAWVGAVAVLSLALSRWRRVTLTAETRWLMAVAILFAAGFAWRDSPTLKALDALAVLISLSLALMHTAAASLRLKGVAEYVLGVAAGGFNAAIGSPLLLSCNIEWKTIPRKGWTRRVTAVGQGLALALPLVLVFGGLFAAADAVFARLVANTFDIHLESWLTHALLIIFYGWFVGGFLRGLLLEKEFTALATRRPASLSLGVIEAGVVLGLLDALFLGFVAVQFRYFFGGAARVAATTGLTYAEYARRGFFELVTAAALVLPVLLFAHWLLRKGGPAGERVFRYLAGAQVLLLFIIMASAVRRMRLYQSEYGLTELRLYTTAFMGWLALVFVWFAATVLRMRRERFAFGALVAGCAVIAVLHFINPDGLIVRANVEQAKVGRRFDAGYAVSLSADAVPALVRALPDLSQQDRRSVAEQALARWSPPERVDWRTWSWARSAARHAVAEKKTTLMEAIAGQDGK